MSHSAGRRPMYPTRSVRVAEDDWANPSERAFILRTVREDAIALQGRIYIKVKRCGRLETVADIMYVVGRGGFNTRWHR